MNKINKKGEMNVGGLVIIFIGIIVAIALFAPIADTTGDMTNLRTSTLANYTTAATVNNSITLVGRELVGSIVVVNASNTAEVWTSNFNTVSTNTAGRLAILLKTTDAAGTAGQNASLASVTYTYKPQGYNDSSGARSIIGIVLVFAALAIMAFVVPGFKDLLDR